MSSNQQIKSALQISQSDQDIQIKIEFKEFEVVKNGKGKDDYAVYTFCIFHELKNNDQYLKTLIETITARYRQLHEIHQQIKLKGEFSHPPIFPKKSGIFSFGKNFDKAFLNKRMKDIEQYFQFFFTNYKTERCLQLEQQLINLKQKSHNITLKERFRLKIQNIQSLIGIDQENAENDNNEHYHNHKRCRCDTMDQSQFQQQKKSTFHCAKNQFLHELMSNPCVKKKGSSQSPINNKIKQKIQQVGFAEKRQEISENIQQQNNSSIQIEENSNEGSMNQSSDKKSSSIGVVIKQNNQNNSILQQQHLDTINQLDVEYIKDIDINALKKSIIDSILDKNSTIQEKSFTQQMTKINELFDINEYTFKKSQLKKYGENQYSPKIYFSQDLMSLNINSGSLNENFQFISEKLKNVYQFEIIQIMSYCIPNYSKNIASDNSQQQLQSIFYNLQTDQMSKIMQIGNQQIFGDIIEHQCIFLAKDTENNCNKILEIQLVNELEFKKKITKALKLIHLNRLIQNTINNNKQCNISNLSIQLIQDIKIYSQSPLSMKQTIQHKQCKLIIIKDQHFGLPICMAIRQNAFQNQNFSSLKFIQIIKQLVCILKFLHEQQICHRQINTDTIYYDQVSNICQFKAIESAKIVQLQQYFEENNSKYSNYKEKDNTNSNRIMMSMSNMPFNSRTFLTRAQLKKAKTKMYKKDMNDEKNTDLTNHTAFHEQNNLFHEIKENRGFLSPEVLNLFIKQDRSQKYKYNPFKLDIYALGIVLGCIYKNKEKLEFKEIDLLYDELKTQIKNLKLSDIVKNPSLLIAYLILGMIEEKLSKRITLQDALFTLELFEKHSEINFSSELTQKYSKIEYENLKTEFFLKQLIGNDSENDNYLTSTRKINSNMYSQLQEIDNLLNMAKIYQHLFLYDQSMIKLNESQKILNNIEQDWKEQISKFQCVLLTVKVIQSIIMFFKGQLFFDMRQYEKSIIELKNSIDSLQNSYYYCNNHKNNNFICKIYNTITIINQYVLMGLAFKQSNKLIQAKQSLKEGLISIQRVYQINEPNNIYFVTLIELSKIYNKINQPFKALECLHKAFEVVEPFNEYYKIPIFNQYFKIYYKIGQQEKALWTISQAQQIIKFFFGQRNTQLQIKFNIRKAKIYNNICEYEKAEWLLKETAKILKKLNCQSFYQLFQCLFNLAKSQQKKCICQRQNLFQSHLELKNKNQTCSKEINKKIIIELQKSDINFKKSKHFLNEWDKLFQNNKNFYSCQEIVTKQCQVLIYYNLKIQFHFAINKVVTCHQKEAIQLLEDCNNSLKQYFQSYEEILQNQQKNQDHCQINNLRPDEIEFFYKYNKFKVELKIIIEDLNTIVNCKECENLDEIDFHRKLSLTKSKRFISKQYSFKTYFDEEEKKQDSKDSDQLKTSLNRLQPLCRTTSVNQVSIEKKQFDLIKMKKDQKKKKILQLLKNPSISLLKFQDLVKQNKSF